MIRYDPTLVDLTSNFFVLCTNVKAYIIIHSGWSLACIFMKEEVHISFNSRNIFMAPVIDVLYFWFFDASTNLKLTNYVYR